MKEQRRQHVKTATHEPECKRPDNNNTSKQQPMNRNANRNETTVRPRYATPTCGELSTPVNYSAAMIPRLYNSCLPHYTSTTPPQKPHSSP